MDNEIEVDSIEDDIIYFSYNGKEMMLNINAINASIKKIVNDRIDNCEVTTWDQIFRVLLTGNYCSYDDNTFKIICCDHKEVNYFTDSTGQRSYYCTECYHIYAPLRIAINNKFRVVSSEMVRMSNDEYYVSTYLVAYINEDNLIEMRGEA